MKLMASWKHKYAGININNYTFYIFWSYGGFAKFGYEQDYYDGPIHSFYIYRLCFQWIREKLK